MPHRPNKATTSPITSRLYLLGAFRIERATQTIHLPTRKHESLLAYLVLHSEAHPREKIAALFWGDVSDEQARLSLRVALSTLRKELGDDFLLTDRETVQINPKFPLWVDAREIFDFRFPIFDSSDQSKIMSYRGDLLPDFYDDWVAPERERLRSLYLDALLQLVQHARSESKYTRAVELAQRILATDRAHEKAHQHLMFCYAALGNRAAALKQYEDCVRALRDELGVEPSAETTALCARIQTEAAAAKSPEAVFTNLPIPLTSFVGRKQEITEIKRLLEGEELHPSAFRLLTLTGAGGCGKTRLAIRVATEFATEDRFQHGVWWVDLAALSDPALVTQTVAMVFNLSESPGTPLIAVLTDYLHAKELLLVIDNCEHLLSACAQLVGALLGACPKLQILATSREALNISGETVWRVPSLALPDPMRIPPLAQLRQYDAIQLFVERAMTVAANWRLAENTAPVAHVCARLDGIPLAIELATARLKVLSAQEIAARLDDRFNLLTGGSRSALPRHQTLRAAMDWSYDLLSDAERALFRRLAVFGGGFTLDAVESVCAEENKCEMLDLLSQLVQKSLVVAEQSGKSRYRLLETIREYALAKLRDAGETDLLCARHLDYFLKFAEEIAPNFREPGEEVWVNVLEMEHDNFRAASRWAEESSNDEAALRLACALFRFWSIRGYLYEAQERYAYVLALPSANEPRLAHLRARALFSAAMIARSQSDYAVANPSARESLAIFRMLGDNPGTADALMAVGLGAWEQGNYVSARSSLLEYLAIWKALGSKRGIANALRYLGITERELGNYAEGRRLIEQSVKIHRDSGFKRGIAQSLMHLGSTAITQRDPSASSILEEGLAIFQQLGDKHDVGRCLHDLGQAAAWQGDYKLARACFEQSMALLRELGDRRNAVKCVEGLAGVAVAHGRMEQAARLFGASEAVREKLGTPLPASYRANYERTIAALATQVDEEQMERWWAEGRAMSLEQAIEYALENVKAA